MIIHLNTGWLAIGISFLTTLIAIKLLYPLAIKLGLVDKPGGRKKHQGQIPLVGGVAVFVGMLFAGLLLPQIDFDFILFYIAAALMILTGIFDDRLGLSAKFRILPQLVAALLVILWGNTCLYDLGSIVFFPSFHLTILAIPITLFAFIGMINATNMVDGVDGLLATLAMVQFSILLFIAIYLTDVTMIFFLASIVASLSVFLYFNFCFSFRKSARIFFGDSGSMLLGFTLVWCCIHLTQGATSGVKPIVMLWLVMYPLYDCTNVFVRRIRKKHSPFTPDRQHLHHQLLAAGFSAAQVSIIIASLSLLFAGFAIIISAIGIPDGVLFILYLLLLFYYVKQLQNVWQLRKWLRKLHQKR